MSQFQTPGLYRKARAAGRKPVQAVSTSTYASVAWLRKGPTNVATLVTSFGNFVKQFGSYWRNSYLPNCIENFFNNGGSLAYVVRVVPDNAAKASNSGSFDSPEEVATIYSARHTGSIPNLGPAAYNVSLDIEGGGAADVDITGDAGVSAPYTLAQIISELTAVSGITVTEETLLGGGSRFKMVSDTPGATSHIEVADGSVDSIDVQEVFGVAAALNNFWGKAAIDWTSDAAFEGAAYNQVRMVWAGNDDYPGANGGHTKFDVTIEEESAVGAGDWEVLETYTAVDLSSDVADNFVEAVVNPKTLYQKVTSGVGYAIPRTLQAIEIASEPVLFGDAAETDFSGTLVQLPIVPGSVVVTHGAITATDDGDGVLSGTGITSGTINYVTGAWALVFTAAPAASLGSAAYYRAPTVESVSAQLISGTDGTGPLTNALFTAPALEDGLEGVFALDKVPEVLNVSLPDFAGDKATIDALLAWNSAEERRNRFIIACTPKDLAPVDARNWMRNTAKFNSSYLATYYPWVTIEDPLTTDKRPVNIPPDGFIAGVFARTDINRNVGKAPAGINEGQLVGAIGLERDLIFRERKIVSPARLNVLVNTPDTGIAVWGARLSSLDPEWVYVQARRLFLFAEMSIEGASMWATFENNGPGTWGKLQAQGNSFFGRIFKDGYLKGKTPAEAYHIVVDESNNDEDARDAGLITVDYYLAVNKPGEFVQLRFQKKIS